MLHLAVICKGLTSLNLSYCDGVSDVGMKHFNTMTKLTTLNLSYCRNITDGSCQILKDHMNQLRHLDVSNCNFTDNGVVTILEGCLYLEYFSIASIDGVRDRSIRAIQTNACLMKLLGSVNLSRCTSFSNECLIHLLEHDDGVIRELDLSFCVQIDLGLIGFQRNFKSTKCNTLKLRGLRGVCDSMMTWLAEGCKNLHDLDLSDCCLVTDSSLEYLAKGCTRVKSLNLSKCLELTDKGITVFVFGSGRQIRSLSVRNCNLLTDKSLTAIGKNCKVLKSLDLFGLSCVSDIGIKKIAEGCHWLEKLDISADINSSTVSRNTRIPHIGSSGVACLGQYCRYLTTLYCQGAVKLDSTGIIGLSVKCINITILSLRYCHKVGNDAISEISNHCHSLSRLDVGCCVRITDKAIIVLSEGCKRLEQLNLYGLKLLTDISIISVSRKCFMLKKLVLRGCERVSDTSVCCIANNCKFITDLDLYGVAKVTDYSVHQLKKCDLLRRVDFSFTEVSISALNELSRELPFSTKKGVKMKLEPIYESNYENNQFAKVSLFGILNLLEMYDIVSFTFW